MIFKGLVHPKIQKNIVYLASRSLTLTMETTSRCSSRYDLAELFPNGASLIGRYCKSITVAKMGRELSDITTTQFFKCRIDSIIIITIFVDSCCSNNK